MIPHFILAVFRGISCAVTRDWKANLVRQFPYNPSNFITANTVCIKNVFLSRFEVNKPFLHAMILKYRGDFEHFSDYAL